MARAYRTIQFSNEQDALWQVDEIRTRDLRIADCGCRQCQLRNPQSVHRNRRGAVAQLVER